jgi:hypothetical protein
MHAGMEVGGKAVDGHLHHATGSSDNVKLIVMPYVIAR